MEDLKKIAVIAIAVALGIFLFKVLLAILGLVFDIVLVLLLIAGGIYVYQRYFKQS